MAATSWAPAYGQGGTGRVRVASAYVVDGFTDAILTQQHLPIAMTTMTTWLMNEVGYEPPARPITVWPPSTGQIWPR